MPERRTIAAIKAEIEREVERRRIYVLAVDALAVVRDHSRLEALLAQLNARLAGARR